MQDNIKIQILGYALSKAEVHWGLEPETLSRMAIDKSTLLLYKGKTHLLNTITYKDKRFYVDLAFIEDDQKPVYDWDMDTISNEDPDKLMQEIFPEIQTLQEGLKSTYIFPEEAIFLDDPENNKLEFNREPSSLSDLEHLGLGIEDISEVENNPKEVESEPGFKQLDDEAIRYAYKDAMKD